MFSHAWYVLTHFYQLGPVKYDTIARLGLAHVNIPVLFMQLGILLGVDAVLHFQPEWVLRWWGKRWVRYLAYLFLINRLFSEAPVVFLQRHPLDVCLSSYFQAFELEASMGYFLDLQETARYYDAVMQVAALSMEQVGNPLHSLRYEDLVADPENRLRPLLEFLGPGWDARVLDYRRSGAGASDTPSYQQVSQPLYTRSVGRWRHYARQLEPVMPVLQPWIKQFGYGKGDG